MNSIDAVTLSAIRKDLSKEGLVIADCVGGGAQGGVYKLADKTGRTVAALKLFYSDRLSVRYYPNQGAHLVSKIKHPGILSPSKLYYKQKNGKISNTPMKKAECIGMVFPYINGSVLDSYVPENAEILFQVGLRLAQALEKLSNSNIAHGDLHASNIMVENNNPVIIDFDLSRRVREINSSSKANDVLNILRSMRRLIKSQTCDFKNGAEGFLLSCIDECIKEVNKESPIRANQHLIGLFKACFDHLSEMSVSRAQTPLPSKL